MKRLLLVGVLSLLIGLSTISGLAQSGSQVRGRSANAAGRFVGAWRLAWLEEPGTNGKVYRADCTGLLVFTPDSHMSVQVMYRNPHSTTQAEPVQYAQGGYEASFGTYVIHKRSHTFTYHVEGALVRSLVGKDFRRVYQLSGKQLIIQSPAPNEHWRVAWEHY